MTIAEQVNAAFITAMKAKDAASLSTIRMLKSALKNKQIDLMRELTDEDALAVIKTQIKQLKDGITDFEKAGRADLAEPAKVEVALLEQYLPAQMDDSALESVVKEALAGAGIVSKADAGRAMGVAMKAVSGQADAGRVKAVVERLLAVFALVAIVTLVAHPVFAATTASSSGAATSIIPFLRLLRAFLLLLAIAAVNMLIVGGFTFMVASGRDHAHEAGMSKMMTGALATVTIFAVFAVVTVAIQQLSGMHP